MMNLDLLLAHFLVFLKTAVPSVPAVLSLDNGDTTINPYDITNTFNYLYLKLQKQLMFS